MQQSELLMTILNDYLAEKSVSPEARKEVEKFYEYATTWLFDKRPIGLGHASGNGLSVRFADSKELVMISSGDASAFVPPAVSITGTNGGSVRHAASSVVDFSRGITGNNNNNDY